MSSKFLERISITKEKAESLKKIRIIKPNLIHIHGLPKSLSKSDILKSPEYLGQYGTILRSMLTYKLNPNNNKRNYSAYITYSNEREAALAVLCVDSLMIKGNIIRAFFGTTKYCIHFLNNSRCPNLEKCFFMHQLATDKDIIIDSETVFSYNEHINLSKKILNLNIPDNIDFLRKKKKPKKNVFPSVDFIFLSEGEKENYFRKGSIGYVKSCNDAKDNVLLDNMNNNDIEGKPSISYKHSVNNVISKNNINNSINENTLVKKDIYINDINEQKSLNNFCFKDETYINRRKDPFVLPTIFSNSIKHILLAKPYFNNINRNLLKKMEFDYFKQDLMKQGFNMYNLLYGCLDCIDGL